MIAYQCPNCGGQLYFSGKDNVLRCESCNTDFKATDRFTENIIHGSCINCGSPIELNEHIRSGFCSSCGSSYINDNLQATEPDYILPFKIDKKEAERLFREWFKSRPLAPRALKEKIEIKTQDAYLMPFWVYSWDIDGTMKFTGTKTKTFREGKYEVTEISKYALTVSGNISMDDMPCDAMIELEDDFIDCVAPFDNSEPTPYTPVILSGNNSKVQDYSDSDLNERAQNNAANYAVELCKKACHKYSSVKLDADYMRYNKRGVALVYYPIYIFRFHTLDKTIDFYMNGQTGRISGNTPVSFLAFMWLACKMIFTVSFIYFSVGALLTFIPQLLRRWFGV